MAKNSIVTMQDAWEMYAAKVIAGVPVNSVQYGETRKAFYAGMICLWGIVNKSTQGSEEFAMRIMDGLEGEKNTFMAKLVVEAMEEHFNGRKK